MSPEEFAAAQNVSRETLARLKAFVSMLEDWNSRHNLVSRRSMDDVWRRHIWDSAQLLQYIPVSACKLVDLGSGAGFPGLVLAEFLRNRAKVTLMESTGKKCDFLRAVVRRLELNCEIRNSRIEHFGPEAFDVVTSRACAPLSKLLDYAQNFSAPETVLLLLKGRNIGAELTEAHKYWKIRYVRHASHTDASGCVLEVREFCHV